MGSDLRLIRVPGVRPLNDRRSTDGLLGALDLLGSCNLNEFLLSAEAGAVDVLSSEGGGMEAGGSVKVGFSTTTLFGTSASSEVVLVLELLSSSLCFSSALASAVITWTKEEERGEILISSKLRSKVPSSRQK